MTMMSKDETRKLLDKALSYATADETTVTLNGQSEGNIRYAINTVTTSGFTDDVSLAVQSAYGKKSGVATINQFDDDSIRRVVKRAEELARLSPENPEYMPILGPQEFPEGRGYIEATANVDPAYRAKAAADSIVPSRENDMSAAGYFSDQVNFIAMANSKGLFAYDRSTSVNFSTTIRTESGDGSGWATRDFNDVSKLDTGEVSRIAIQKAQASVGARAIEPGKYTVILEPAASVQLISNMAGAFDARQADEGRSFMTKKGGGNRIGEKIFDERVTVYSDPMNAEVPGAPFAGDGQRLERTEWVTKGVAKNMAYSRFWAEKQGVQPVPGPNSFIMEGGDESLEELIAGVRRGILVTRLWYIRTVDPQTQLYTGLTRDGTFFVEDGKITYPVKNLRFNESPVIVLNNIEKLGKPQRINGNLVPPMVIRDFTFTSLSDAV